MSGAKRYAHWVLDPKNERETGRLIKLACQRFLNDLERTDIYFDESEAVKMVDFCEEHLRQWEGDFEGEPLVFQDWQRFHLEQIFGWIRKDTGTRRFEEVYIQIAKKNGKSTESAGLGNYHLFADTKVKTPKIFTAANNEEQAKIAVNMAGRMCEFSPGLIDMKNEGLIGLMRYKENITEVINYENNGFIKALTKESSDKKSKTAGGKHGVNASLGIVDEFGMSPDHGASKAIKTSMASRRERLMFYITTAGFNLDGPCYRELRKVGIEVLEGTVQKDNYLPIIYEIDLPKDENGKEIEITAQWLKDNEWCWKQANPNLDISVQRDFLRGIVGDAIAYGGMTEVEVMTLNFNRWMYSAETFIPADIWNRNTGAGAGESIECFAGLEVAPSGDASAMALVFPGDIIRVRMLFFIAEDALKRNEQYRDWKDYFKIDPGNEVEVTQAVSWCEEFMSSYQVHSFTFPNTQKNNSIVQALIKNGRQGNAVSQGLSGISNATEEWEKSLRSFHVEHFGNPVLAWQNSNCLAVRKEAGIRIEKNGKVLGIYAILNAFAGWKEAAAKEMNDQLIQSW